MQLDELKADLFDFIILHFEKFLQLRVLRQHFELQYVKELKMVQQKLGFEFILE
jgi:hypothetical protein